MKIARAAVLCVILTSSLCASTVGADTLLMHNGDSLSFLFSSSSFAAYATQAGMSPDPTLVQFFLSSLPVNTGGEFTAEIESPDGAASGFFPAPLTWTPGYAQSSQYSGPTSTLAGSLSLSESLSQALFSTSSADLILSYSGPTIVLGIPGYILPRDLTVSLSDSSVSVGGMVADIRYQPAPYAPTVIPLVNAALATPEPGTRLLFLAGVALCAMGAVLRRVRAASQRNNHAISASMVSTACARSGGGSSTIADSTFFACKAK
jgi:hypothetical protein